MSEDNGTPGAMGGSCGAVPRAPGPVNATGRGNQTERADVGRLLPVAAVDGGASLGTSRAVHEDVLIPGGVFAMGEALGEGYPADGDAPVCRVRLDGFQIDATAVTNRMFAAFVQTTATGPRRSSTVPRRCSICSCGRQRARSLGPRPWRRGG